jgi:hypothetical protein
MPINNIWRISSPAIGLRIEFAHDLEVFSRDNTGTPQPASARNFVPECDLMR